MFLIYIVMHVIIRLKLLQHEFSNTNRQVTPFMYHHHHPVALTIQGFKHAWKLFPEALTETTHARIRSEKDVHPTGLVLNTMAQLGAAIWEKSNHGVFLSLRKSITYNRKARNQTILRSELSAKKTKFLCVNDDTSELNDSNHRMVHVKLPTSSE